MHFDLVKVSFNGFGILFKILSANCETPISAVVSQNITNKSCLVCVKNEKYAFWVNLKTRQTVFSTLRYKAKKCQAMYMKPQFSISAPP